jgi:hypothetical protein
MIRLVFQSPGADFRGSVGLQQDYRIAIERALNEHHRLVRQFRGALEAIPRHVEILDRLARKIFDGLGVPATVAIRTLARR